MVHLRRRLVTIEWWVTQDQLAQGKVTKGVTFDITLQFNNDSPQPITFVSCKPQTGSGLSAEDVVNLVVPPRTKAQVNLAAVGQSVGYHVAHGIVTTTSDAFGLFHLRSYFPSPIGLRVHPKTSRAIKGISKKTFQTSSHQTGENRNKRKGQSGDLSELRNYAAGDPLKRVAWKASAKKGSLVVKEFEPDVLISTMYLLDAGASMRRGQLGYTKLDHSIDLLSNTMEKDMMSGMKVGLLCFDSRVISHVLPGNSPQHKLSLSNSLLSLSTIVDEDLTDITAGELVSKIGEYFLFQEGLKLKLPATPPINSPEWQHIQAGSDGSLFDLRQLHKSTSQFVESIKRGSNAKDWLWTEPLVSADSDKSFSQLRLFCKVRGIQLPYRQGWNLGQRSMGFSQAISSALNHGRTNRIVIVSDFAGVFEDVKAATTALTAAKQKGRIVDAAFPWLEMNATSNEASSLAKEIFQRNQQSSFTAVKHQLLRHGIRIN